MARTGTEIMIEKLIKMVGLDPALILSKVDEIRKSVTNAGGDIAAIRKDQLLIRRDQLKIMAHLDIQPEQDYENGESERAGTVRIIGH